VTLLQLIAPKQLHPKIALHQPVRWLVFDSAVEVTVQRESGRIDLNSADQDLLFAAFAANGWDEMRARAMAARIADWRDADDLTREVGAERAEYESAGLAYEPRNGPFETVDELRQVLGAEAISQELLSVFTVYTRAQVPSAMFASPIVYRALAYADARKLGGRQWLGMAERRSDSRLPTQPTEESSLADDVIRVSACATRAGSSVCRSVIARPTVNVHKPFQIFAWRDEVNESGS